MFLSGWKKEIDTSVSFADLKQAPGEYVGRTVMIGGNVIRAKRTGTGNRTGSLATANRKRRPM